MAFQYGISANLNVDGALANVEKLIKKLDDAEKKASGLKVNVSINNELVSQLKSLKDIANAQKDVTTNTAKQAQEEQKLAALEEKTAGIKQKNAQQEKLAEEQLNQAKARTAAQEKKNASDAAVAEQKLAAQKKSDADAELQRAQKLRTEEQKTATEAAKTANEVKKGQDAAAAAAQNRMNAQRKADIDAATAANRYAENATRGEERIQQEKQRTAQMEINTAAAILSLLDRKDRVEYNAEQRKQRAAEAEWRRQQRIQKEQKENDDAIARDLEKQARIEKAQQQIADQKTAKTKELRAAIEANQKAQEDYNRVLAKALPTVNEIRRAMQNLSLSQENLKTAYYRANSPLSGLIGKVGENGTWGNTLQRAGGFISKMGESLQGITQGFYAVQQPAENAFNSILGVAKSFFNQAVNGFTNLTQEGLEAFGTLEMAEIGFANFFNGSAGEFTRKIKEAAVEMPMVGAADLARSVQYIAPLAKGNSDLALSAVEGVMKSIVYSGNDVSQYGTKALQNLTQVASGNLTATDIKEMMRQMPALPRLLASTDTGGELLENGQITTKAVKNYIAKYGSDAILGVFKEISEKSEASDIYETANKTFKGAMEQLREKMVLAWQDTFEQSGASDLIRDLLNDLAKDGGGIDKLANALQHYAQVVVEWVKNNEENIKQLMDALFEGLGSIASEIQNVVKEVLQVLEIVDGAGQLNVSKLKEVIKQITDFIKGLVKGFGTGLKQVLQLVETLRQRLGDDVFIKLGQAIGWLASPMAKLITSLGMLGSNALRATGGITTLLSGIAKWGGFDTLITNSGKHATKRGNGLEKNSGGRITSAGFTSGVGKVASMAGKGIKAASFVALGVAADQVVDSFMELTGVPDEVQTAVSGFTAGISGAAAGFQIFGLKGALIGGVIGAFTGLVSEINEQKKQLQEQKNADAARQSEVTLEQGQEDIYNYVVESLAKTGYNLDVESKAGRFSSDMLKRYIKEQTEVRDENGNLTGIRLSNLYGQANELAKMLTSWDKTKQAEEVLAEYTNSTEFTNKDIKSGGKAIDFKKDTASRDWLADFVERNILNGDKTAYDYTRSNEEIVDDYLGDYQLTYEQLALLKDKETSVYDELSKQTTDFSDRLENIDNGVDNLINSQDSPLVQLNGYTEGLDQKLGTINSTLVQIAKNTGSDNTDFVDYSLPGNKFWSDEVSKNYDKWADYTYKQSNMPSSAASMTVTQKLSEWTRNGEISGDTAAKLQGALRYDRATVAEAFGKTPGDNDDYMETWDKVYEAKQEAINKRDTSPEGSDDWKKWDYVVNSVFVPWQNTLAAIKPGDWVSLFKFQVDAEKALGEYGVHFRAAGGIIDRLLAGRGRGVDTVPAFLQPGEFVMRRSAVEKAGTGVFAALNRGDFAAAAHAIGNKFNSSWDNSHHWNNQITTNNNNTTSNYFFAGGQVRGRRAPYRSIANRVATV